jgi:hypothetical protein
MTIRVILNERGNPPGKVADAELYFDSGPLAGLKLVGFAVWTTRGREGRTVTFPARQYSVNGERRSFSLLRQQADVDTSNTIRALILEAVELHERATVGA